jgi:hypothetical protein
MRCRRAAITCAALLAGAGSLAGCDLAAPLSSAPLTPPPTPATGTPLPPESLLSVSGTRLLRGGATFVPHGVTLVGFQGPYAALRGPYLSARDAFGPDELVAARGFGADTIRFLVAQPPLTPPLGNSGLAYRSSLIQAVDNARALGFVVIIALEGSVAGAASTAPPLPDEATIRTWEQLAPLFGADHGVGFELYESPAAPASAASWQVWASGGNQPGAAGHAVGMQQIVDGIRATGAGNVVVADGLDQGHTLDGVPLLSDPAGAVVYGVEPYPRGGDNADSWNTDFGDLARSRPVLATAWDAPSAPPPFSEVPQHCDASTPDTAHNLLRYLAAAGIGVIGYAFDLTGTLVRDLTWAETSYDGLVCGQPGYGPGVLLSAAFRLVR